MRADRREQRSVEQEPLPSPGRRCLDDVDRRRTIDQLADELLEQQADRVRALRLGDEWEVGEQLPKEDEPRGLDLLEARALADPGDLQPRAVDQEAARHMIEPR